METKSEKLPKNRTKFTVTVDSESRARGEKMALETIGASLKLKGFRPGKAPEDMVKAQVSPDEIVTEAARALLPDILRQAIGEKEFKAVLPPRVSIKSKEPLVIEVLIIERPDVKLKKPDGIKLPAKEEIVISAAERDAFIEKLLAQDRVETPVERPVEKNDFVRLGLSAVDGTGKAVAELAVERYPMQVGSDDLLPELTEHVIGMKSGETKAKEIAFPEEHDIPAIRGKKVTVTMTVKSVATVKNPELTPEFLKSRFGIDKTPDEFRSEVEKMLKRNKGSDTKRKREDQFFDQVREHTAIELPDELLDAEVEHMVTGLMQDLQQRNVELDDWLKSVGKDRKTILEEMKQTAGKRIALRYGLEELIAYKKIAIGANDIGAALMQAEAQAKSSGQSVNKADFHPGGRTHDQITWEKQIEKLMEVYGV